FDAEFERTRPRPGLRGRVIANAVATPRIRQRSWLTPRSFALVGAAAAVLVVAGIGLRFAIQSPPVAIKPTPSPAPLVFGKLPAPGFHIAQGFGGGGGAVVTAPYFGPATMTWSGQLPTLPASAPVYRFSLPTLADADAFAARLGATLTSPGSGKEPRSYRLPGFNLDVSMNDPLAGEPTYILNSKAPLGRNLPFTEDAAHQAADTELARRGLTPPWKASVQVSKLQGYPGGPVIFTVLYQRVIALGGGAQGLEVDGNGNPSGLQVDVDTSGHAVRIAGILRDTGPAAQSAAYPVRTASAAVPAAVAATPLVSDSGPVPTVTLNKVTLVYMSVVSGDHGYLEPAYLFTGTFDRGGYPYEKRVSVPALALRALGP
ncbi:MAG TPA: hypothetical protein VF990_07660, partial [Candidatus Dormibacteraeota bacterium]